MWVNLIPQSLILQVSPSSLSNNCVSIITSLLIARLTMSMLSAYLALLYYDVADEIEQSNIQLNIFQYNNMISTEIYRSAPPCPSFPRCGQSGVVDY